MTLKNHRLRSSLKLLFFGLEFCGLFLSFLFLISFPMLFRAIDSGVPPRSSTVPVSIQVQCKYGGVVWFVEELGRFDQAFFIWRIIQGAVNVNWLSRFWTRTTTRPYLFKLNQTLQYQRMQRYFYPFTDIFCCKKSSTPNLSHHLRLLKYQLIFWRLHLPKKKERKEDLRKKNSFHHHQVGDRVATVRATDLDSGGIILNMSWDFSLKLFVVFFIILWYI